MHAHTTNSRGGHWAGRGGILGFGLLALGIPAFAGLAGAAHAMTAETQTVPLDSATAVTAELDMDFGVLNVGSAPAGGADLFRGEFSFDDDEWRPAVDYRIEGDTGNLDVQQPGDFRDLDFNDLDDIGQNDGNRWDVQLSPDVPLDLTVDLDTGSSELDLGGLDIRTLDVESNAGEITVDLSGVAWEHDLDAAIDLEAGTIKLIVPSDVGVRIDADTTVGDVDADGFERDGDAYVTAAFGESSVTLRIDIDVTAGEIDLEVSPPA